MLHRVPFAGIIPCRFVGSTGTSPVLSAGTQLPLHLRESVRGLNVAVHQGPGSIGAVAVRRPGPGDPTYYTLRPSVRVSEGPWPT